MVTITELIMIALFIEAVIEAVKPIWTGESKLSVSEYVSMALGVLLAVSCRINMLAYVMEVSAEYPVWINYVFYVLTGLAMGRGSNFLYDLVAKMKEWKGGALAVPTEEIVQEIEIEDSVDLEWLDVSNWELDTIKKFAAMNGFVLPDVMPSDDEMAKAFLIDWMFGKNDESKDAAAEDAAV